MQERLRITGEMRADHAGEKRAGNAQRDEEKTTKGSLGDIQLTASRDFNNSLAIGGGEKRH